MTDLKTLCRATISTALLATAALSGVAHADTAGEIAKFDAKTKTYCIVRQVTGSVLTQRACATRHGWIQMGATVTPAPSQLASK